MLKIPCNRRHSPVSERVGLTRRIPERVRGFVDRELPAVVSAEIPAKTEAVLDRTDLIVITRKPTVEVLSATDDINRGMPNTGHVLRLFRFTH